MSGLPCLCQERESWQPALTHTKPWGPLTATLMPCGATGATTLGSEGRSLCPPGKSVSWGLWQAGPFGRLGPGPGGPSPACSVCMASAAQSSLGWQLSADSHAFPYVWALRQPHLGTYQCTCPDPTPDPESRRVAVRAPAGIRGCCSINKPTCVPRQAWGPSPDQRSPSAVL